MKVKGNIEKKLWQVSGVEYLSYLLVFISPLLFSKNTIFSFGSPKMIMMIMITLIMVILFLSVILVEKKLSFRFTPIHLILGVFIIIITISSVYGIDPINSFFGRWRDGINLVLIYMLAIFALLIGFLVKQNKLFLPKILLFSFISSIFVALISYTGDSWLTIFKNGASTIGNSSYTGAYLLFNICFGFGLFFYYSKIWPKILIAIGFLIIIFSPLFFNINILMGKIAISDVIHNPFLLLGQANASILGLIVSFGIILSFYFIFSSKKIKKIIGLIIFFILLGGIVYTGSQLTEVNSPLYKVYVEQKGENRFIAWDIAEKSFSDNLLLGSGFHNFSYNYQKYFNPFIFNSRIPEAYFAQPHNIILEYASDTGILGLISYLLLLFFVFIGFFINRKDEEKGIKNIRLIMMGLLFGYFIQNLFGFDTPITFLLLFLVIGIAIGLNKKEWVFEIEEKQNIIFKVLASVFIMLSFLALFIFVISPIRELKQWAKAPALDNVEEKIIIIDKMQKISLFGGVWDSSFLASKFYSSYIQKINQINDTNKHLYVKEIDSLINQIEIDIERQPNEIRSYIAIGQLLNLQMNIEKKVDEEKWNKLHNYLNKAREINSLNPEIFMFLSQTYLLKQDFDNAYLTARQAIEIAPFYKRLYDYANNLMIIKPNPEFKKYITEKSIKWNINLKD